jgi:hypothetical protein
MVVEASALKLTQSLDLCFGQLYADIENGHKIPNFVQL